MGFYRENLKFCLEGVAALEKNLDLRNAETGRKLVQLEEKYQVRLEQVNGQRNLKVLRYTGQPSPPNGCEIFIGKIPRDVAEDEIYPLFLKIGPIFETRLMMDFSGANRGYGFLKYISPDDAVNACKILNDFEIKPGRHIGVCASRNNCRLFVTNLPSNIDFLEAAKVIFGQAENVKKVGLYRPYKNQQIYMIIFFYNHRDAAMARRVLVPNRDKLFPNKKNISIDWAAWCFEPAGCTAEIARLTEDGITIEKKTIAERDRKKEKRSNGYSSRNSTKKNSIKTKIQKFSPLESIASSQNSSPNMDDNNSEYSEFSLFQNFTYSKTSPESKIEQDAGFGVVDDNVEELARQLETIIGSDSAGFAGQNPNCYAGYTNEPVKNGWSPDIFVETPIQMVTKTPFDQRPIQNHMVNNPTPTSQNNCFPYVPPSFEPNHHLSFTPNNAFPNFGQPILTQTMILGRRPQIENQYRVNCHQNCIQDCNQICNQICPQNYTQYLKPSIEQNFSCDHNAQLMAFNRSVAQRKIENLKMGNRDAFQPEKIDLFRKRPEDFSASKNTFMPVGARPIRGMSYPRARN